MKADVVFALENAGWPALWWWTRTGTIHRGDPAAVKVVWPALRRGGAAVVGRSGRPETASTAEQFLAQWERSPRTTTASLKFRVQGGGVNAIHSLDLFAIQPGRPEVLRLSIAARGRDPAPAPAAAPSPEGIHPPESALAQKQKLDCALQLARTVALDFNNALTSILGHTSLVLSKMEPNHPWRASLMEVEKSAAKAAEIANDLGDVQPAGEGAARASRRQPELDSAAQRGILPAERRTGSDRPGRCSWSRKLFAAKFDEAKMQQAFMKILENAVQAVARAAGGSPSRPATSNWLSRRRIATCGWRRALTCAWRSATTAAASRRMCCRGSLSRSSRPRRAATIAGWVWPGSMASSPTTAAAWRSPASRARAPPCGSICRRKSKIVRDNGVPSDDLNGTQTILMVDDEDLLLTMGQDDSVRLRLPGADRQQRPEGAGDPFAEARRQWTW